MVLSRWCEVLCRELRTPVSNIFNLESLICFLEHKWKASIPLSITRPQPRKARRCRTKEKRPYLTVLEYQIRIGAGRLAGRLKSRQWYPVHAKRKDLLSRVVRAWLREIQVCLKVHHGVPD